MPLYESPVLVFCNTYKIRRKYNMMRQYLRDVYESRNILIVLLTPLVLLPLPLLCDGQEAKCAYAILIMSVFWITEALPIAVTALVPVFLFPLVGLMSVKETSKQYINDTNMISLGSFIVAAALEHWDIHRRVALKMLLVVGTEPRWLLLGLMATTWLLSMWMSNTTTATMMIPMANALLLLLKEAGRSFEDGRYFNVFASVDDDVALEIEEVSVDVEVADRTTPETVEKPNTLEIQTTDSKNKSVYERLGIQSPVSFASWMAFGVPTSLVLFFILWVCLQIIFLRQGSWRKPGKSADERVKDFVKNEYNKLGQITFGQGAVIGHFLALATLWITREMGGKYGWSALFPDKYVKDAVPAMLISTLLFVFPSKLPKMPQCCHHRGDSKSGKRLERVEPLLPWKVAVDKVPWGLIFLLGGGFAMAHASEKSGLSRLIGSKLTVFQSLNPWVLNLVLCFMVSALTEVTSNVAMCTLMMPILSDLAISLQLNPMYLMFPAAIATSFAYMLPVATGANAVVFSYGYVNVWDMVKVGLVLKIVFVIVLIVSTETLGELLYKLHTIPIHVLTNASMHNTSDTLL